VVHRPGSQPRIIGGEGKILMIGWSTTCRIGDERTAVGEFCLIREEDFVGLCTLCVSRNFCDSGGGWLVERKNLRLTYINGWPGTSGEKRKESVCAFGLEFAVGRVGRR
jgi:hypothetical protein